MLAVSILSTLTLGAFVPEPPEARDPCAVHAEAARARGLLGPADVPLSTPAQVREALLWLRDGHTSVCDVTPAFTVAHRVAVSLYDPRLEHARDWALEVILELQDDWRDSFLVAPASSWRRRHIALAQVRLVAQLLPLRWRYALDTRIRIYRWAGGWGPEPANYGEWLWTLGTWLEE